MITAVYVDDVTLEVLGVMHQFDPTHGAPGVLGAHVTLADAGIKMPAFELAGEIVERPAQPSEYYVWQPHPVQDWVVDMAVAKAAKWQQVKAERNAAEFGPFSWATYEFDGDAVSQARLSIYAVRAQAAIDASEAWEVDWTLADNSDITLTATDLLEVVVALGDGIEATHAIARAKRVLIDAATSVEDLDAI